MDFLRPLQVEDGTAVFARLDDGREVFLIYRDYMFHMVRCPTCFDPITEWEEASDFYTCGHDHYWRVEELEPV